MASRAPNGEWQFSSAAIQEIDNLDLVEVERRTKETCNELEIADDFSQDQVDGNKRSKEQGIKIENHRF